MYLNIFLIVLIVILIYVSFKLFTYNSEHEKVLKDKINDLESIREKTKEIYKLSNSKNLEFPSKLKEVLNDSMLNNFNLTDESEPERISLGDNIYLYKVNIEKFTLLIKLKKEKEWTSICEISEVIYENNMYKYQIPLLLLYGVIAGIDDYKDNTDNLTKISFIFEKKE